MIRKLRAFVGAPFPAERVFNLFAGGLIVLFIAALLAGYMYFSPTMDHF